LTSGVSALVSTLVSPGVNRSVAGIERAWRLLVGKIRRDHLAIQSGNLGPARGGGWTQVMCVMRIAPSRHPRTREIVDPSAVQRFAQSLLAELGHPDVTQGAVKVGR
jgi:hypothetical protein